MAAGVACGVVTALDAPALLEYASPAGGAAAGRVRRELSEGAGGARLVLTHTGPPEAAAARPAALAAWRDHLERLAAGLLRAPAGLVQ